MASWKDWVTYDEGAAGGAGRHTFKATPEFLDYMMQSGAISAYDTSSLSPEAKQAFQKAMGALAGASFSIDKKSKNDGYAGIANTIGPYVKDAYNAALDAAFTMSNPNATAEQKAAAQQTLGGIAAATDLNSDAAGAFKAWQKGGAQALGDPAALKAEMGPRGAISEIAGVDNTIDPRNPDYFVGPELSAIADQLKEDSYSIPYSDMPIYEAVQSEAIPKREVGQDELIGDRAVDELRSYWDDPNAYAGIDDRGLTAQTDALDYYQNLLTNDGRDAVSDAFMNEQQGLAEQLRKSNVDAALANLDARGMGGSGSELFAQTQGAGQSMKSMYDASLQAAALQQARKDAAAGKMADVGRQHRDQVFNEHGTMADDVDAMTTTRADTMFKTDEHNADVHNTVADKWQTYFEDLQKLNHNSREHAATMNHATGVDETSARNRHKEGVPGQVAGIKAGGVVQDANAAAGLDQDSLDFDKWKAGAVAGQVNQVEGFDLSDAELELKKKQLERASEFDPLAFGGKLLEVGGNMGGDVLSSYLSGLANKKAGQ